MYRVTHPYGNLFNFLINIDLLCTFKGVFEILDIFFSIHGPSPMGLVDDC